MKIGWRRLTGSPRLRFSVFLLVAALLLIARRPDQLFAPSLFVEDGVSVLPALIKDGWWEVIEPLNGYLILTSKVISWVALKLSLVYYPEIGALLGFLATLSIITLIYCYPTVLKLRWLCALAPLLVPIDSEIYFIHQYLLFWSSFLIVLPALRLPVESWRQGAIQAALVLWGGLSGPRSILFAPWFLFRVLIIRTVYELPGLIACGFSALIQVYFLESSYRAEYSVVIRDHFWESLVARYFGFFLTHIEPYNLLAGGMIVGLLCLVTAKFLAIKKWQQPLLLCAFGAILWSSVARVDPSVPHPYEAGPRYFFLPFTLMMWNLIWILHGAGWLFARILAGLILGIGVFQGTSKMVHRDYPLVWREALSYCINFPGQHYLPIHYNGVFSPWQLSIGSELCRKGVKESLVSAEDALPSRGVIVVNKPTSLAPSSLSLVSSRHFVSGGLFPFLPIEREEFVGSWLAVPDHEGDYNTGRLELIAEMVNGRVILPYVAGKASRVAVTFRPLDGEEFKVVPVPPTGESEGLLVFFDLAYRESLVDVSVLDRGHRLGEWIGVRLRSFDVITESERGDEQFG